MNEETIHVVPVGDSTVTAIMHQGTVWVSVRRVCAALGLDPASQRRMLAEKPWAKTDIFNVVGEDGRRQEAYMLALKSLPMWLANINHNKVNDEVAKRLVCFQCEAQDVLAAHFGLPGCEVMITSHPSGGVMGSGGVPAATTEPASVGSGTALQMLQMFDALSGALRASISEVAEVRALVNEHREAVANQLGMAIDVGTLAMERANEAALVADRAARAGVQARESRRRIDAAVGTITSAIRRHCGQRGISFQSVYSAVRADLGLRRTQDGGPALGRAKLRADQVLRLASTATRLGVPGVGIAVITAILDGVDDPTRPGAIDAEVTSMTRVAARSADRTAP